jgi:hypothetical protein
MTFRCALALGLPPFLGLAAETPLRLTIADTVGRDREPFAAPGSGLESHVPGDRLVRLGVDTDRNLPHATSLQGHRQASLLQ